MVPARRRRAGPGACSALSGAVAVVLLAPLVFLLIEAQRRRDCRTIAHLIFRPLTATLLWNTVRLTVVVTAPLRRDRHRWRPGASSAPTCRAAGSGRCCVVVPFAIPDFVVSFGWASLITWVHGFRGAVLVMTLAVYPLVYLPVAASLRGADPGPGGGGAQPGRRPGRAPSGGSRWARPAAPSSAAACWWRW